MVLTLITAQKRKNRYRFLDGRISLGRDSSNNIVCSDPGVSRYHAEIWLEDRAWHIKDCRSSNGTWVNGRRVECTVLAHGDRISLGGVGVVFSTGDVGRLLPVHPAVLGVIASAVIVLGVFLIKSGMRYNSPDPPQGSARPFPAPDGPVGTYVEKDGGRGEELLRFGLEHLRDWKISRRNAYLALKALDQCPPLLEGNSRGQHEARAGKERAERIVNEQFTHRRFFAEQAIRAGDRKKAEEELRAILDIVPDPGDTRAQYARERLRTLERGRQ